MADVCACCGKVLDGYSNVEIDGQIYKLCGNCNYKMKKGKISMSNLSSPMVKNLERTVKKGTMKKHCKIIAVVGGILGAVGTLFQSWQVVRYSMPLALLVLALGGAVAYVIYVMWSSIAEILERLERLERRVSGGTDRELDFTKGEWKCTHCGSVNEEWQDTCRCGWDIYGKLHRK